MLRWGLKGLRKFRDRRIPKIASTRTQCKRLSGCNRFLFRGAVGHDTRHVHNLGNPTPVGLKFGFDFVHNMRHVCVLARGHFWGIKVWLDFPNISRRIGNSPACLAVLSSSWRPIMLRTPFRPIVSVLTAALLLTPSSFAFDSPLSDQAVREAYFLGQRHDASFLSKYIKSLPTPRTGPTSLRLLFSLHSRSSRNCPSAASATTALSRPASITAVGWRLCELSLRSS